MQKVMLLPRLPGYKKSLFTTRLITINQSFAPISDSKNHKKKPVGILWHEAIADRKDEDVCSAYYKNVLLSTASGTTSTGLYGLTIVVDKTSAGLRIPCWSTLLTLGIRLLRRSL